MAEYSLPDGRILNVPDSATQDDLINLQSQLAELYPDYYAPYKEEIERTIGGHTREVLRGVPAGLTTSTISGAKGIAEYFDLGNDSAVVKGLGQLKDYYSNHDLYRPAEGYEDAYSTQFGRGLGSFGSVLGVATLTGGVGAVPFVMGLGVDQQADLQERAKAEGKEVTATEEIISETGGAIVGLTELINPLRVLRFLKKTPDAPVETNRFVEALKTGGIEAAQETGAGLAQEAIARGIYNPDQEIGGSWLDDATVGFGVGATADLIMRSVGGRKSLGMEYNRDQAIEQDKALQQQDEIIKQNVILAREQGDQIIDPALVPETFEIEGIDTAQTVEFEEILEPPVLENFSFVNNPDGTVNVIGNTTNNIVGTFPNIEVASQEALNVTKQNRNKFIASSALQSSSINGLAGNGASTRIGQKVYDPINNLLDAKALANFDGQISVKRQKQIELEKKIEENEEAGQRKLASELMDNLDTTGLSIEELGQVRLNLETQLSRKQTVYPIQGQEQVNPESQLGLLWQKAEKKGLQPKSFYTIPEAKKLLSAKDFDQFMSEKSAIQFKKNQLTGEPVAIKRKGNKVDVSKTEFDKAFEQKNIEVNYGSQAFQYLAKSFTGTGKFSDMSNGQKEMLLAQIKSFPRFNTKTKLPDYTPRAYTANQLNSFYTATKGRPITNADIKTFVKNNATGQDLTQNEIKQLRTDLVNSGRATKKGNRLIGATDFEQQQSANAQSFVNETTEEFRERLKRQTTLLPEEIESVVNGDGIYKQGVVNAEDVLKLPSPETSEKYNLLFKTMRERLNEYGLKDVALRFDKELKASLMLRQKGDTVFYEPTDRTATSLYDRPLKTIVSSLERLDPDNKLTTTELEAKLTNDLDHEVIHALTQMNLLKQSEFDLLVKEANKRLPKKELNRIERTYSDLTEIGINEEKVAELFRFYKNSPETLAPKPRTIIQKIINFFTTTIQSIYDSGFTSARTILRDIESGTIGSRERGEVRNARNFLNSQNLNERVKQAVEGPSFTREEINEELSQQRTNLYNLERLDAADRGRMSNANQARLNAQKEETRQRITDLENRLKNPEPTQLDLPSFKKISSIEEAKLKKKNKEFRELMFSEMKVGIEQSEKAEKYFEDNGFYEPFKIGSRFITKQRGDKRVFKVKDYTVRRIADRSSSKRLPYILAEIITNEDSAGAYSVGQVIPMRLYRDITSSTDNIGLMDLISEDPEYVKFFTGPESLDKPSFSKAGLTPRDVLFAGNVEEEVYKLWIDTGKNPTAQDFRRLHKILAPQSKRKNNFVDYSQLKRDVKDAAEAGIDSMWYTRWGINLPNIVGAANMNEFSGVFGITSGQATPEQNLKDTLRTMIIARKHNPDTNKKKFRAELLRAGVGKGNKARIDAIEDFYRLGIFERKGSSQKTLTYALEILQASQGEFTPFMVIDRHMLRKFGMDADMQSASEIDYRMIQAINSLLSTENYIVDGQLDSFTPPAIQALLWGHQRYSGNTASKITNEGSFDSSLKYSQKEVNELKQMEEVGQFTKDYSFSGKFLQPPRYVSNKQSDVFDSNLSRDMFDSILEKAPQTVIEFKIGRQRGFLPEVLDAPITFARWNQFQNDSLKAITVNNKIKFLRDLGIPHDITRSGGTWEGEFNPNIIVKLPGVAPQTQRAVASVLTDAFMQDAAIVARPKPRGATKTALLINKPQNQQFNKVEIDDLLARLSEITRDGEPLDFTVSASKKSGIILIDPRQFNGEPYSVADQTSFINLIQPVLVTSGYKLNKYGQESDLIEYGQDTSYSTGTRGQLRVLGNRVGFINSSDLQGAALRDLYIPLYQEYKKLANELGFEVKSTPAYLEENSALDGLIDINAEEIADIEFKVAENIALKSRGAIPYYGKEASPIALKTAFDFEDGSGVLELKDKPSYSRKEREVPDKYKDIHDKLEGAGNPNQTYTDTLIDLTEEGWTEDVGGYLSRIRQALVDNLAIVEKGTEKAAELSEEVAERQLSAETGAIQALRLAGQSKSLFAQMLKTGVPVYEDGGTRIVPFVHGGLAEVFAPLYDNLDGIDYQAMFKLLSVANRGERLNKTGKLVPLTEQEIALAQEIKNDYPVVQEVYDKYQEYNNAVLDYAKTQGVLGGTTLVESEQGSVEVGIEAGKKDGKKYLEVDTVELWKENSDYYPFYRQMADDSLGGPAIISGFIGPNPLAFTLKGSEEAISPPPLEVIARNLQSILYASMKNQGMQRLMQEYELANMAKKILPAQAKGADVIPVYEDGQKVFYKVSDPLLIYGLQSMGMNDVAGVMRVVGMPSSILRETVTRDPGFILKNMLRDTLSVAVTSGADFTPFIDTFKNFNSDLSELETRGIIGGYDAARDNKQIVDQINKILKDQGVMDNGGLSTFDSVVKIWDWLGDQTTKSDGSTRKAVADAILELTGSHTEASYQALEVINFNRRGGHTVAKIITTAIPFLNARIQGLDVLYRAATGKYSATKMATDLDITPEEARAQIQNRVLSRGLFLAMLTGIYYLLVGDSDDYRNRRAQERDDNWLIYLFDDLPPLKLPIPFEVGFIFKTVPERALDLAFGRSNLEQTTKSLARGVTQTLKVDPLGFQITKPLIEVANNKSSFTGNEIIPFYMKEGLDPQQQYTMQTTELARGLGSALNISPMKIDYVMKGYGGTLGTYLLTMSDMAVRQATGRDFVTPRLTQMPFVRNLFASPYGGGLQEQFYELRLYSNRYQQTLNKLKNEDRLEEYYLYRKNNQGLASTRNEVLKINRYLSEYRKRKGKIERAKISPSQKRELLDQLEFERDIRLIYVPELTKQSDIPSYVENLFRN